MSALLLPTATPAVPGIAADFSNDNPWVYLVKAVLIIVFLLLSVLMALWFERRLVGRMQVRPGPNVHGPFGLFQALADAMKLLMKEDITVRAADKIVYSSTLSGVSTARTTLERTFDPEAVRRLKQSSASDLSIGGAGIAAEAFRHGLVDECVLLLCPVIVGGGKPALPRGVRLDLELLDHRRFNNGVIYVRHAVRNTT